MLEAEFFPTKLASHFLFLTLVIHLFWIPIQKKETESFRFGSAKSKSCVSCGSGSTTLLAILSNLSITIITVLADSGGPCSLYMQYRYLYRKREQKKSF